MIVAISSIGHCPFVAMTLLRPYPNDMRHFMSRYLGLGRLCLCCARRASQGRSLSVQGLEAAVSASRTDCMRDILMSTRPIAVKVCVLTDEP